MLSLRVGSVLCCNTSCEEPKSEKEIISQVVKNKNRMIDMAATVSYKILGRASKKREKTGLNKILVGDFVFMKEAYFRVALIDSGKIFLVAPRDSLDFRFRAYGDGTASYCGLPDLSILEEDVAISSCNKKPEWFLLSQDKDRPHIFIFIELICNVHRPKDAQQLRQESGRD